MQTVLGMDVKKAVKILEQEGFHCLCKAYSSIRPVEADTTRVIRQRALDEKTVELTVSGFMASVNDNK